MGVIAAMKILVVDDHSVFRTGLMQLLKTLDDEVEILEANRFDEAERMVKANPNIDLITVDLVMPDSEPFTGLGALRSAAPQIPVVVLSVIEQRRDVIRAIELGAMGYIPKAATADEIVTGLQQVLDGNIYVPRALLSQGEAARSSAAASPSATADNRRLVAALTQRQKEVFELLAQGKSNPEIARELGVSAHTVRIHISAILRALGVSNRTQAAVLAASGTTQESYNAGK